MRLSALRLVQFLLLASFALSMGPAPSGAAGDPAAADLVSREIIDICEPDRDCRRACFAKAKAFYKKCVYDGNPRRECRHREQQIHSCQDVGSQFLIANQKFNVTYRKCEGMSWTFDGGQLTNVRFVRT